MRKPFFTGRVAEHWHRLLREIVGSPSLDILKTQLDTILGNLLLPLLEKGALTRQSPEVPSSLSNFAILQPPLNCSNAELIPEFIQNCLSFEQVAG